MEIAPLGAGTIFDTVLKLVGEISALAEEAAFNKERCHDLASRCEVFGHYAKELEGHGLSFPSGLKYTLVDCRKYLIKVKSKSIVTYYLSSHHIARQYEDFFLKKKKKDWMNG